jgi:uncharacterized protein
MDLQTLAVLGILFFSTFVRSAFGFGDALIAMPLLAMVVGIRTATPLVALVAGTIALTILVGNWRHVQVKSAWRLVVSSIVGIPIGLFLLGEGCEGMMKPLLALIVILFSVHQLARPGILRLSSERTSWLFGFAAGILGGALNTNGPPLVVYGSMRQWNPATFRATLQGYFFTTGWFILLGHFLAGLWTSDLLTLYAGSLPVVLPAVFLGGRLHRVIPEGRYDRAIHVLLLAVGALLLYDAVRASIMSM